jgi:hypothetical protein
MNNLLMSATSVLALCVFATMSSAAPTTGPENQPEAGSKGPNGTYASEQKGGMGSHASGGKGGRQER